MLKLNTFFLTVECKMEVLLNIALEVEDHDFVVAACFHVEDSIAIGSLFVSWFLSIFIGLLVSNKNVIGMLWLVALASWWE